MPITKVKPAIKQPLSSNAKRVFKGVIFDVYQWEQKMYDDSTQTFEKLKRPSTVGVIPVTSEGQIILTEEDQPGKTHFLSIAGGRVEEGEEIEEAARRELLEETGFTCKELILWDVYQPLSKIDWTIYTFIAKNCTKIKEPELDAGEKITLKYVNFKQFLELASSEEFDSLEITLKVLRAKLNPNKMKELKELFS